MRIIYNPQAFEVYQIELSEYVLHVYFSIKQIDVVEKKSVIFKNQNQFGMIPLPIEEEKVILSQALKLLYELNIDFERPIKVYNRIKSGKSFLISQSGKNIQVDTELCGLHDLSSSLFLPTLYDFKHPERNFIDQKINQYKEVYSRLYGLLNGSMSMTHI